MPSEDSSPVIRYTAEDVRRAFTVKNFTRGQYYQRLGRARVTSLSPDGGSIEGEVHGSGGAVYPVAAKIFRLQSGRLAFGGECGCPVGYDCKHLAALMLEALSPRLGGTEPARPTTPPLILSPEVAAWLARLDRLQQSADEDYPPDIRQRLFYVLDLATDWQGQTRPVLAATSVRLLANGEMSDKVSVIEPSNQVNSPSPAKYLRGSDLAILRRLQPLQTVRDSRARILSGDIGADILQRALATGRCRWGDVGGPPLNPGAARSGGITWGLAADGRMRPRPVLTEGDGQTLAMTPPWYVDPTAGLCGPLELGLTPDLAAMLLAAPPLAAAEIGEVRRRLAASLGEAEPLLPPEPKPPRRIRSRPVPRLRLFGLWLRQAHYWSGHQAASPLHCPMARLSFLYDEIEVSGPASHALTTLVDGEQLIEVARQIDFERDCRSRLSSVGLRPMGGYFAIWSVPPEHRDDLTFGQGHDREADEHAWVGFLANGLPRLVAAGWRIDTDEAFPLRLARAEGEPEMEIVEDAGMDWFDLHLGISVDGQRVDILPALMDILRRQPADRLELSLADPSNDPSLVKLALPDGRLLLLPYGRLRPILQVLAGLYAAANEDDGLRFSVADAVEVADLAESMTGQGVAWRGGEKLRALGKRLKDAGGRPEVEIPELFQGRLRPYQQTGVGWMQLLREVGLGGILADDMGLGKTVQALAHLAVEKAAGRADLPSLILAPTSVLPNWRAEAANFTPSLKVLALHGAARQESFADIARADLVLSTYPLLARDIETLAGQSWHMVIIDEAQAVKNPATAAAKALRRLDCRHRLAMTGTPLENHLGELWALFDFVSPGFLGDARGFAKTWRTPIEKRGDKACQAILSRRVRPFLLRRTKDVVAAELPPKTEIIEHIELAQAQRDLYEGIRLTMHRKIRDAIAAKGLRRSRIEFLDALLKLRQACCDPRLVKRAPNTQKAGSAKLVRLMEMLPELLEEGRRILLFSQFTSMLALIEEEVKAAGIPYLLLTGATRDRATPVRRFQDGRERLFLISLKAGGTGLNLTAADTVIHYDPWWNPAVESQATDRAHRIGQDKPVFVHKLVAVDSIEVKMAELKARKQALADGLFGESGGSSLDLGEDDIEFLLGK